MEVHVLKILQFLLSKIYYNSLFYYIPPPYFKIYCFRPTIVALPFSKGNIQNNNCIMYNLVMPYIVIVTLYIRS